MQYNNNYYYTYTYVLVGGRSSTDSAESGGGGRVEGRGRFGPESFRLGHVCGRRVTGVILKYDDTTIYCILYSPAAVAPSRHDRAASVRRRSLSGRHSRHAGRRTQYITPRCTKYATPPRAPPSTHHRPVHEATAKILSQNYFSDVLICTTILSSRCVTIFLA